jgi:hypothetical protein
MTEAMINNRRERLITLYLEEHEGDIRHIDWVIKEEDIPFNEVSSFVSENGLSFADARFHTERDWDDKEVSIRWDKPVKESQLRAMAEKNADKVIKSEMKTMERMKTQRDVYQAIVSEYV